MGRSKQGLERTYKSYSDDELLNMYSKGILTELAQGVMKDEINKRGLTVSEKIESIARDPSIVRDPENKSSFGGIMRKIFGYFVITLSIILYLLGIAVLAKEVNYSFVGLKVTLTNGILLGDFIATGIGALMPGIIFNYIGLRLIRPKKSKKDSSVTEG